MSTVYKFKPLSKLKGDAQKVGETIEAIRQKEGAVSPAKVVEAAKDKESVLHRYFEWNDKKAGASYREQQAAHLLRALVVVSADDMDLTHPVRAFVSVRHAAEESDDGKGTYTSISEAVRVVSYREQLIQDALRDLDAYRVKYALLNDIGRWGTALVMAREALAAAMEEKEAA